MRRESSKQLPECLKCRGSHLLFVDLSAETDRRLKPVASLLEGLGEVEALEVETFQEIGRMIADHLSRRMILEAAFFGRSMVGCSLSGPDLRAEISRIRVHLRTVTSS